MDFQQKMEHAKALLSGIDEETQLDEVIRFINKLPETQQDVYYPLAGHLDDISRRYDETLKKLAQ